MQYLVKLAILLALPLMSFGQNEPLNPKMAMEKLSFLEGQWSGSGWQIGQDRKKHSFTQTEDISFEANGEVLLVKGLGKTPDETGKDKVIHSAIALISYNTREGHYDFRSYAAGRGGGNFTGKLVKENHFEWYLETPQSKIKYTITLNEKGQWHETGEMAMGENWFQFFEMTLDKQ